MTLNVDVDGATVPGHSGVVLGAVVFGPDGVPEPRITLFVTELRRLVADTRVLGAIESEWPATLRDKVVGRALGRVLAHEIGHYILRQRHHAPSGLMRSLQRSDDLVAPARSLFRLSAAEAAQIQGITARLGADKKERTDTYGRPWG